MQQRVLVLFQDIQYPALTTFLRQLTRRAQCPELSILQLLFQLVNGQHILLALIAESYIYDRESNYQYKQPDLRTDHLRSQ